MTNAARQTLNAEAARAAYTMERDNLRQHLAELTAAIERLPAAGKMSRLDFSHAGSLQHLNTLVAAARDFAEQAASR